MSLVNEMLNDLQKTQSSSIKVESYAIPEKRSQTGVKYFWLLLLIFCLIAYYLISQQGASGPIEKELVNTLVNLDTAKDSKQNNLTKNTPIQSTKMVEGNRSEANVEIKKSLGIKTIQQRPKLIAKSSPIKQNQTQVIATTINTISSTNGIDKKESNSTPNKTVKKSSEKNSATKAITAVLNSWDEYSISNNKERVEKLLLKYPIYPNLWYKMLSFISNKEPTYYPDFLEKVINQFPLNSSFNFLSAKYYFGIEKYEKASLSLRKVNKSDWNKSTYQLAGLIYQKLKRDQQAIYYYKKLLSFNPGRGDVNMAIAISYEKIGNRRKALSHFLLALKDPRMSDIQRRFVEQHISDNS